MNILKCKSLKRKVKIQELIDLQTLLCRAQAMLDLTLIPDRAMPTLLLNHQNLYKWRTYCRVCVYYSVAHKGELFIVSQGRFQSLVTTFPRQSTARRPPRGRPAMNFGQTDIVKSVCPLPPSSKCTYQGPTELAPKWARSATS
jgi:hypothetical protein